jgi:hypothetical protein
MPYPDATRGLAKLRERGAVTVEREERLEGGFRYRYWPTGGIMARQQFLAAVRSVEALNELNSAMPFSQPNKTDWR